jgi:hypothetical protein
MKLEHAERIVRAAEDLGLEVELRQSYSGRGRSGRSTAGVVGSRSSIIQSIAAAAVDVAQAHDGDSA